MRSVDDLVGIQAGYLGVGMEVDDLNNLATSLCSTGTSVGGIWWLWRQS